MSAKIYRYPGMDRWPEFSRSERVRMLLRHERFGLVEVMEDFGASAEQASLALDHLLSRGAIVEVAPCVYAWKLDATPAHGGAP